MKMSKRELSKLSTSHLSDGARGLSKSSARDRAISERMRSLFFSDAASSRDEPYSEQKRRLQRIHAEPPVYLVPHFLSPRELDHLDELLTTERRQFKRSHTDGQDDKYVGDERTSISLALPKAADATLRAIEARAAELVGLPSDHVEPLQIVHYSEGARFDMHHDLAPIRIRGEDDDNEESGSRDDDATAAASEEGAGSSSGGGGSPRGTRSTHGALQPSPTPASAATPAKGPSACLRSSPERESARLAALTAADVTVEQQDGPRRLITLFLYLNTLPEGVGHTEFPLLKSNGGREHVSVRPRSGTALLFCNVDAAGDADPRLCHRACPVPAGHVKFGCNVWITDVSQQAHAVAAQPTGKRAGGAGAAANGKGLLAPLLFQPGVSDPTDLPPPPPAALLGLCVSRTFTGHGTYTGRIVSHAPTLGFHLEYAQATARCPLAAA